MKTTGGRTEAYMKGGKTEVLREQVMSLSENSHSRDLVARLGRSSEKGARSGEG